MRVEDRFWSKVHKTDTCWLWTGYTQKGYGSISVKGRYVRAHRWIYKHHYGIDPAGLCVCHHCDNPLCVNPDHLFLGTPKDNVQDMIAKGRARFLAGNSQFPSGEQNPSAKLSASEVFEIRQLYQETRLSHRKLAKRYGVTKTTIYDILNRHHWKHI